MRDPHYAALQIPRLGDKENHMTDPQLVEKFAKHRDAVATEVVERDDEIIAMQVALVGGLNFFSLGPPGVAKSMTNDRLLAYIEDVNVFHRLLTRQDSLPDL